MNIKKTVLKYDSLYEFLEVYCKNIFLKNKGYTEKTLKQKIKDIQNKLNKTTDIKKKRQLYLNQLMEINNLIFEYSETRYVLSLSETNHLIKELNKLNSKILSKKINTPYINKSKNEKKHTINFVIMKMNFDMLKFIINVGNIDIKKCYTTDVWLPINITPLISTIVSQKFDMFLYLLNLYNLNVKYSICNGKKIYLLDMAIYYYTFENGYDFISYIYEKTNYIPIPKNKDFKYELIHFGKIDINYNSKINLLEFTRCNVLKNKIIKKAKLTNRDILEAIYNLCWIYCDLIKSKITKNKKEMVFDFFKKDIKFHRGFLNKPKQNLLKYESYIENETLNELILRNGVKGEWLNKILRVLR